VRPPIAALLVAGLVPALSLADATPPPEKRQPVPAWLADVQAGKADLAPLVILYDDLHPFHGGLMLAIHGDGRVEQKAVRETAGKERTVSRQELLDLVKLLVELQAWEQKTPERPPVPDESRARLTIAYRADQSHIWEWYNDMPSNKRMIVIRERMKKIAWTR
jgi:hypothetical protein